MSAIKRVSALPAMGPMQTPDPFLFCVYHKDNYPAAINDKCEAPRQGNGMDFGHPSGWSMYHGEGRVPGFPQHPHRGFETLTATLQGVVDHTDSMGNAGRYGHGDNQWMTAGAGIVHGEMFPLVNTEKENPTQFFQIWLNLPPENKMVDPNFVMHWKEEIPVVKTSASRVRVFAGEYGGCKGLPPPKDSWAADSSNEVSVLAVEMFEPGAEVTLPAAQNGSINRALYFCDGEAVEIDGKLLKERAYVELNADAQCKLVNRNSAGAEPTIVLMLQGRPIGAPVAQHGPFVMNTQQEIMQAFDDYRRTQFGGWPWKQNAVIFPRTKGRFAKLRGTEITPPVISKDEL